MSPKVSKSRSVRFPNLYKYPKRSRFWVYRRFSPERDQDFSFSTGEEQNEKVAHQIGETEYHKWLLLEADEKAMEGQEAYFGDYAQAHLDRKLARPDSDFSKNSKRTSKNATRHLIEAFGHLKLEKVTEERWEDYCNQCSQDGVPPKFFNRLKELKEVLRRAHRNGLIKRLPEFRNPDPETDAGRYLEDWEVKALIKAASPDTALLVEVMWRQGPRPDEALQYEWSMINWRAAKHGAISIPARITKTRRARTIPLNSKIAAKLKARQKASKSTYVFPSPDTEKGPDFRIVEYKTGWEGALKRSGIPHAVPYDLRRTFITNCAKRGKAILWVAKYTDTSTQMIERFYAKVQQDSLQGVVE
jgi:integrase